MPASTVGEITGGGLTTGLAAVGYRIETNGCRADIGALRSPRTIGGFGTVAGATGAAAVRGDGDEAHVVPGRVQ